MSEFEKRMLDKIYRCLLKGGQGEICRKEGNIILGRSMRMDKKDISVGIDCLVVQGKIKRKKNGVLRLD